MADCEDCEEGMDDFRLVEPFEIDAGELDGLTPEQAFTLGVEWEMVRRALEIYERKKVVHRANCMRIVRMARRHGREVPWKHLDDHWSELDWSRPDNWRHDPAQNPEGCEDTPRHEPPADIAYWLRDNQRRVQETSESWRGQHRADFVALRRVRLWGQLEKMIERGATVEELKKLMEMP